MKKIIFSIFILFFSASNLLHAQSRQGQDLKQAKEDLNYCMSACNLRYNSQSSNNPGTGRNNLNCTNECVKLYQNKTSCITSQLNSYYDSKRCESGSYYESPLPKEIDISGLILKFFYLISIAFVLLVIVSIFFPKFTPWVSVVDGVVKIKLEKEYKFSNLINGIEFKLKYMSVLIIPIFILSISNVEDASGPSVISLVISAILFFGCFLMSILFHAFANLKISRKIYCLASNIFIAFLIGISGHALGFLIAQTIEVSFFLNSNKPFWIFITIMGFSCFFSNIIQIQYHSKLIAELTSRELLMGLLVLPLVFILLNNSRDDEDSIFFIVELLVPICSVALAKSSFSLKIFTFFDLVFRFGGLSKKYLEIFKNKLNA